MGPIDNDGLLERSQPDYDGPRSQLFRHEAVALGYANGAFDVVARDPERARRVGLELAPTLRMIERLIAPNGTVLGAFTIADVSVAPPLYRSLTTELDLAAYPKLSASERGPSCPARTAAGPAT